MSSYVNLAMRSAAVSAGALAVCTAAGGGFYLSGGAGYLWKKFLEMWYGVADNAVDGAKKVLIESLAFACACRSRAWRTVSRVSFVSVGVS